MNMSHVVLRPAEAADLEAITALLQESRLPVDGLREALPGAVVATRGGRIVGCVAVESHGRAALLRSLVVSADERGCGLGAELTAKVLAAAQAAGIRDVYL